jgi:hypothetical protein
MSPPSPADAFSDVGCTSSQDILAQQVAFVHLILFLGDAEPRPAPCRRDHPAVIRDLRHAVPAFPRTYQSGAEVP